MAAFTCGHIKEILADFAGNKDIVGRQPKNAR